MWLVPELCRDPRGSILRSENCIIISFIEIEDFLNLVQDDSADCSSNFQSAFGEFGDDSPSLAITLSPSVPYDDASLAILSTIL